MSDRRRYFLPTLVVDRTALYFIFGTTVIFRNHLIGWIALEPRINI